MSQNSTQPFAMPYVASSEPMKIHASAQTGSYDSSARNTGVSNAVPPTSATTRNTRWRHDAQRGTTATPWLSASASPSRAWVLRHCTHP
ncbi:Uncharacterised protein [Mycobacteroides abscessus]|nr:Uncharacterised protein [Mycobacteroides abscessus]